jgi:hypothetical protein
MGDGRCFRIVLAPAIFTGFAASDRLVDYDDKSIICGRE